jgi:hypothetical protein
MKETSRGFTRIARFGLCMGAVLLSNAMLITAARAIHLGVQLPH